MIKFLTSKSVMVYFLYRIKKDENCDLVYDDILQFLDRTNCPVPDVPPSNIKVATIFSNKKTFSIVTRFTFLQYDLWWCSEREPDAGSLIDWCAFNKELDLESTFKDTVAENTSKNIH